MRGLRDWECSRHVVVEKVWMVDSSTYLHVHIRVEYDLTQKGSHLIRLCNNLLSVYIPENLFDSD